MIALVCGIRIDRLVDRMAALRPQHPALIQGEQQWTYAQLQAEMDRRAAILRAAGLQPGEVVGTTAPISGELLISFLACCRADLPLVSLSARLAAGEVRPLMLRAQVRLLLTDNARPHSALPDRPTLAVDLPGDQDAAGEPQLSGVACSRW